MKSLTSQVRVSLVFLSAVALSGMLFLTACGGSNEVTSSKVEEQIVEPLSEDEVKDWESGASGYTGRKVTAIGKVFNIDRDGDDVLYQIYTDPVNYDGNTLIYFKGINPDVKNDAYVRVTGVVLDSVTYENAFGGELNAPCMQGEEIEEISYIDAVSPTIAQVTPNTSSEQNGYSITIDKIEFAANETRVYVTLTNNGAGRLSVYDYDAVIIQNGKQYNTETNYEAGYPDINHELAIGASMSGIICFPEVEQSDLEIQMHGYSDNYEVDGGDLNFTFDISVD